jgi:hypothetical protein
MPEDRIDVSGLWGAVEGYAITALESPRASITTLSRHFGFDAVETEGVIRFVMRGRASVATLDPDDLVAAREGDVLELTRGQETELPQALKWQIARADEDYDAALVEARRITVDTTRIASESFPMAVPPEEAERRCRRALMEAWVGRETAAFRLPPSRLALDPADVIRLAHDGRLVESAARLRRRRRGARHRGGPPGPRDLRSAARRSPRRVADARRRVRRARRGADGPAAADRGSARASSASSQRMPFHGPARWRCSAAARPMASSC